MALYYNRSGGVLPLSLTKGRSFACPPHKWVDISGSDETTADVMRHVREGRLMRAPTPTSDEIIAAELANKKKAEEAAAVAAAEAPADAMHSDKPSA